MPTQNLLVVTVADVDAEDHADNSFLIGKRRFGHKAKLLSDHWLCLSLTH